MSAAQYIFGKSEKDGKYYLVPSSIVIAYSQNSIKFKLAKSRTPVECFVIVEGIIKETIHFLY